MQRELPTPLLHGISKMLLRCFEDSNLQLARTIYGAACEKEHILKSYFVDFGLPVTRMHYFENEGVCYMSNLKDQW